MSNPKLNSSIFPTVALFTRFCRNNDRCCAIVGDTLVSVRESCIEIHRVFGLKPVGLFMDLNLDRTRDDIDKLKSAMFVRF